MARIFIYHDKNGKILSIASVETMHDQLPHPFLLDDTEHGVIETTADDPALAAGLKHAHEHARVEVAAKLLIFPQTAGAADPQPAAARRKKRAGS